MMKDGIRINGLHSFDDFGLYIKEKKIGLPSKKIITDTVPYMNGSYDFTLLSGDATWGPREISYSFDIMGDTEIDMNQQRDELMAWLMNIHDADIYDDAMEGYHFHGSYSGGDMTDDEELSEFTADFVCYPFRIANAETEIALIDGNNTIDYTGQGVTAYIICDESGSVTFNGTTQSFLANTRTELSTLVHGENTLILTTEGSAVLCYTEEVF